ncbi:MAG: threonine ammonia-lyase, biosynthetic [Spirochaetes bacterium]|nr:threonine ammonia-lyase, biosynthetic [Spirochaetota bacterium]
MIDTYIKKILNAQIYDIAMETPIESMQFLSQRLNNQVLIKREDLQPIFSFKLRGAANKIANLNHQEKCQGIIAASAGNHAQGVALAAKTHNIDATIVMPKTTPSIKVESVKEKGAKVVLHGDTFDEAYQHAQEIAAEAKLTFIHPYDDPDVIAGQGTIAMEILRQYSQKIDAIFVPVGGGGLIAGIAVYIKYLRPSIKIIGVESEESACLKAAIANGERVVLPQVGIFADGVAVAQIGSETFRIARQFVDEVITVNTDEICAAIKDLFDDTRSIAEPAGALAIAGLKQYCERDHVNNQTLIAIESGANVNFDRLRHISERAELGERREAIFAVTIPEKPGSFKKFCQILGKRNITEFNYRYSDPKIAHVFVGIQLSDKNDRPQINKVFSENGYEFFDLTNDEIAKIHIRHMVGGHAKLDIPEQLFCFEFPERPGALMKFLLKLGQKWNISMFHYRNHGAAFGRVFLALQVPADELTQLNQFLDELGYQYKQINDHPAYNMFLS